MKRARPQRKAPRQRLPKRIAQASPDAERPLRIGEAAQLVGVEAYVLRFWETQFPMLRPRHTRSKHRYYLPEDIERLRLVKRLLHDEGFTIAGAKKHLKEHGSSPPAPARPASAETAAEKAVPDDKMRRTLAEVRRELESLHRILGD